jgi:hypothetical protein
MDKYMEGEFRPEFTLSGEVSLAFRKACLDNLELISVIEEQEGQLAELREQLLKERQAGKARLAC